jgi:type I restriction enzyme S subunit
MITAVDVAILRPPTGRVDTRFLNFYLASAPYLGFVDSIARGGTRQRISREQLGDVSLALPSVFEQRAIADYLDIETVRIDALIERKRRMVELLRERCQVIERELTLLDTSTAVPLRWFIAIQSGEGIGIGDLSSEGRYPVIGGNGEMGRTDLTPFVREPSVAVGRVGALCGNVHLVEPPAWITDNALWVRVLAAFDRRFLALALRASDLNARSVATAQPLITGETVKSLRLPCPPLVEQRGIVAAVEALHTRISGLVNRLERQVELLIQRRQALITAAVTGELDIPGVAA